MYWRLGESEPGRVRKGEEKVGMGGKGWERVGKGEKGKIWVRLGRYTTAFSCRLGTDKA